MIAPAQNAPLLSVEGLSVRFAGSQGAVHAVNDVSFSLGAGQSLGIVGESGSGKSVTTQALLGLVPCPPGRVTAGHAWLGGRDLLTMPDSELRRVRGREVAMVFQDPMSSFNPVLRIGLQLTEAIIEHQGVTQAEADRRAIEMLELVGIASPRQRMDAYPHQFSGGQLQRVGIAMALVCKPTILIADEPTTALDVTIQAQIVELVARLQKQLGMAIIWISHDLHLVAGLVERVAVMYAGSIVETVPVGTLFSAPAHPYTIGLIGAIPSLQAGMGRLTPILGAPPNLRIAPVSCPFAPRCADAEDRCLSTAQSLEPVGDDHAAACWKWRDVRPPRAVATQAPREQRERSDVLLEVRDLAVHYPIRRGVLRRQVGAVRAVDGVSFTVMRGETLALVGESGCGKSTTGRAIMGLTPIAGGHARLDGVDDTNPTPERLRQRRRMMQMIFQNPYGALNPRMTVGRIVGEGLRAQRIGTRQTQEDRVREVLSLVGLPDGFRSRYPFELSGGQRQRVGIARALAAEPRFIIADEPISALDVSIQAQIVNLLADLRAKLGLTYLFISHDLSMVRHLGDRVAVMYLGEIVEIGATADVFARPAHPYTRALLSAIPALPAHRGVHQGGPGRIILGGAPPNPAEPPGGCRFHPRCIQATDLCRITPPVQAGVGVPGREHLASCHYASAVPATDPP